MRKTKNNSIEKELNEKNDSHYAKLKALCRLNEVCVPQIYIEKVSRDLIEWSELPTSLKLTQFMRFYGIPEPTYYRWIDLYPEFKKAHWYALTAVGDRREIGAIEKKYDAGTIALTLSQYCSVAASAESRRSKLRREEQGDGIEDLTNCVRELVEQKWGDKKDNEETK